jgi:DNA-binding response OmpR family regulator
MDRSILLVEDDPSLGMILKEYLTIKGYNVELAIDGESGLNAFLKNRPHLCIIDIMMPKKDGFELAKEIKIVDNFVPIIFLSAKSGIHDKIKGLSIGADDYVIKPFIAEELLLRIEAILRRTGITDAPFNESHTIHSNKDINKNKFIIGEYIFDYNLRILQFNNSLQALTSKECELLRLLCINQNILVTREKALLMIWGDNNYFNGRSMDVFITKLRKHLKSDPSLEIVNVHGSGYKLMIHRYE